MYTCTCVGVGVRVWRPLLGYLSFPAVGEFVWWTQITGWQELRSNKGGVIGAEWFIDLRWKKNKG